MNAVQENTLQAFRRMKGWLAAHPELATGSAAADAALLKQVAAFSGVVEQLTTRGAQQESATRASRGSTAAAGSLRIELIKNHMQPVADMAKASIPDVVRMTVALRMPRVKVATEKLLNAAEAMAKAGEEYKPALVERGLHTDFVEQLRQVASDYKLAIDTRGQQVASRRGARAGIAAAIADGEKLVLSLSVIINNRLRADSAALAEWNQLKRVTIKGSRSVAVAAPAPGASGTGVVEPPASAPATVVIPAVTPVTSVSVPNTVTASGPARTPVVPATEAPAKAA